ncbi:hypothetical protein RCL_jg5720.t1 [Rhizophagus clarus]|uniref:Uncharacterized protein n=1 Tax=Rhizophagus clarus TaxID=94130 RepID=A0A8H3M1C9_9GLOM|nr:hypothetical protein RCL_jg5720.t1 [Rhizophagus clarus]
MYIVLESLSVIMWQISSERRPLSLALTMKEERENIGKTLINRKLHTEYWKCEPDIRRLSKIVKPLRQFPTKLTTLTKVHLFQKKTMKSTE